MKPYYRRCPKCRRKMEAERGQKIVDGKIHKDAVLRWRCVGCQVTV